MKNTVLLAIALLLAATVSHAQLQYRQRLRSPSERITFIQAGEKARSAPLNMDDVSEIQHRMAEVEKAKDEIGEQLHQVQTSITKEEEKIHKQVDLKKEMAKRAKLSAKAKAEERKKLAEAAALKVTKMRLKINGCLNEIKGGANKVYWKLRNLFARTEPEQACTLLKHYDFPSLPRHGYSDKIYKKYQLGREVPEDGSHVLSFEAIKIPLFKCMCTTEGSTLQRTKFPIAGKAKMEEEYTKQAEKEKIDEESQKKIVKENRRVVAEEQKVEREIQENEKKETMDKFQKEKDAAGDTVAFSDIKKPEVPFEKVPHAAETGSADPTNLDAEADMGSKP